MAAAPHLAALYDPEAHAVEQARLGQVWTLLGYASDLPRDQDWFRARLGGRSVFIQRFGTELRGFENRCAHRSYPLRTAAQGTGPILCAFHHWRYDSEGEAVGIPNCLEAFGVRPAELGRRLTRLDVACCGDLLFARFPGGTDSLQDFLGAAFEVLAQLCADMRRAARTTMPVAANWRFSQWISLDEYHLPAVHPDSFRGNQRYIPRELLNYTRFGPNSAYFLARAGTLEDWSRLLRDGERDPVAYRMIHLFPDVAISLSHRVRVLRQGFRYIYVVRHVALGVDRCVAEIAVLRASNEGTGDFLARSVDLFEPLARRIAAWRGRRILREDHVVCETLQAQARQLAGNPVYGAAEARAGWFDEAYAAAMRPVTSASAPPNPPAGT